MKKRWENIRHKRWFKIVSNKFFVATIAFAVWMLFLDINSWTIHHELNTEIENLENSIEYYQIEIQRDQQQLEELTSDPEKLEKFAREQYLLQKKGEEVYIIEVE